jgi:hypothetical protein
MPTLTQRIAAVSAAVLLGPAPLLAAGAGIAQADPYDDADGTVQVDEPAADYSTPDVPDYEPQAPEPQMPEPEPQAPEPEAPEPGGSEPGVPDHEPAGGGVDGPGGEAPGGEAPGAEEPGAEEPAGGGGNAGGNAGGNNSGGNAGGSSSEPATGAEDPGGTSEPVPDLEVDPEPVDAEVATADATDITTAEAGKTEVSHSQVATTTSVEEMQTAIDSYFSSTTTATLTQWDSAWVQYDQYYQPVLVNPYRTPIQIAYRYGGKPYVVTVPPLQRTILNVPKPGVYNFTALVPNGSGGVSNVSVGSFSGGGYVPKPGQPPPPKPATPTTYKNVVVRFALGDKNYKPIIVKSVTDLGDDPAQKARKVLLDEETPAWGTWGQTKSGQRQFTVTLTDRLPGLTTPSADPPPGFQLAAAEQSTAQQKDDGGSILPWVGIGVGVVAIVAVILVVVLSRKRPTS